MFKDKSRIGIRFRRLLITCVESFVSLFTFSSTKHGIYFIYVVLSLCMCKVSYWWFNTVNTHLVKNFVCYDVYTYHWELSSCSMHSNCILCSFVSIFCGYLQKIARLFFETKNNFFYATWGAHWVLTGMVGKCFNIYYPH